MNISPKTARRGFAVDVFECVIVFIGLHILLVLWASILFVVICHIYIPNVYSLREIRLGSFDHRGRIFSTNTIPLSEGENSVFTANQAYKIELNLILPDSPINRDSEMSSVRLELLSNFNNRSVSLSNTILPTYKPWFIDTLDTLFFAPLYLFRVYNKEQNLNLVLANNYVDHREFPTLVGRLILESNGLRWYSADLVISAVLSPFVKLLYEHSWLFGAVFVITITILVDFAIVLGICIRKFIGWSRDVVAAEANVVSTAVQTDVVSTEIPIDNIEPQELTSESKPLEPAVAHSDSQDSLNSIGD